MRLTTKCTSQEWLALPPPRLFPHLHQPLALRRRCPGRKLTDVLRRWVETESASLRWLHFLRGIIVVSLNPFLGFQLRSFTPLMTLECQFTVWLLVLTCNILRYSSTNTKSALRPETCTFLLIYMDFLLYIMFWMSDIRLTCYYHICQSCLSSPADARLCITFQILSAKPGYIHPHLYLICPRSSSTSLVQILI